MKKTMVAALAAALTIGAASTTFAAANPFSDVPSDHWAYDAVTQLAADGVIEGYGDGTYRGDRNITRYEMAQMVAKAMAKGGNVPVSDKALIDRLAAEFADELNNLGVRVTKLERNADMVKWNGKLEYTYTSERLEKKDRENADNLVFRLEPSAEVNNHWHVNARLDASTSMKADKSGPDETNDGVTLVRAWAQGDYDNFTVKLGKMELASVEGSYQAPGSIVLDKEFSGGEVSFGKDLKAKLQAGQTNLEYTFNSNARKDLDSKDAANYQGLELQYDKDKFVFGAGYYRLKGTPLKSVAGLKKADDDTFDIWAVNGGYRFDKNVTLSGAYAYNNSTNSKRSGQVSFDYKGADPADKGSWGAYVSYRHLGGASVLATQDGALYGTKGIELGTNYTIWNNVVLSAKYFKGKTIEKSADDKVQKLFGRVEFLF